MRLLVLVLLLVGCGRLTEKPVDPIAPAADLVAELRAARQQRLDSYNLDFRETDGWPSDSDCDATLWAGEACAGGAAVNYALAEHAPGEIHRRPGPACWTKDAGDQGAQNTVSREMIRGYLACLWATQDLDALDRLATYAEKHAFKMGEPLGDGRVLLGTNLTGLLGRMIYALSAGADQRSYSALFEAELPVAKDFEEHALALDIGLQGDVAANLRGQGLDAGISAISLVDISPGMKSRLEELVQAHPADFLFQAELGVYTGEFAETIRLLMAPPAAPSYVRGDQPEAFERARWLFAAKVVLDRFPQP